MRYNERELNVPSFPDFPSDGNSSVCPTGALLWPNDSCSGPTINQSLCIGCCLCATRCPVGAISISKDGTTTVTDVDTNQIVEPDKANKEDVREDFLRVKRIGCIRKENDRILKHYSSGLIKALFHMGPRFPNIISRNLMIGTGWRAAARRAGDTNVRVDLVADRLEILSAIEVEFSNAIIDAPRSVLDSLAILLSRYDKDRSKIIGLVAALELPNLRSEYWQVIADIQKALDVRVYTVTVTALSMLLWNNAVFGHVPDSLPFATIGHASIRDAIEMSLGRSLELSLGCASALESSK